MIVPPGQTLPEHAPLEFDRDIRLLPLAPDSVPPSLASRAQTEYLSHYNGAMAKLVQHAHSTPPSRRPMPMPRPAFALYVAAVLLPLTLIQYLRYRLGAYTRSGEPWTAYMFSPVRGYLSSTYTEEGQLLLRALWAVLIATVPWMLLIILLTGDRPLQ